MSPKGWLREKKEGSRVPEGGYISRKAKRKPPQSCQAGREGTQPKKKNVKSSKDLIFQKIEYFFTLVSILFREKKTQRTVRKA